MKEELIAVASRGRSEIESRNLAREYLQARILLGMQEAGAMIPLAFQGGTALRFLYGLPRFSEDLDFALERPEHIDFGEHEQQAAFNGVFDLARLEQRIMTSLKREGYEVATKRKSARTVNILMLGFVGLLNELGLSPHGAQLLRIRIDIDTRPPSGATLSTTIIRRHALLHLQHHDRASLLAGKIHAILQRTWTKGRDLFDLFWYLSDRTWPEPNLTLLNNALEQTEWEGPALSASNWRGIVSTRLRTLDWVAAQRDVAPFLEPGPESTLFTMENVLGML